MLAEETKVMRVSKQLSPVQIMIDQNQLDNTKCFNYFVSMTNDEICIREISIAKAAFNKKTLFTTTLDLNLRKKLLKCYIWSTASYGAGTLTLRTVHQI
jgi:hypothetical protein